MRNAKVVIVKVELKSGRHQFNVKDCYKALIEYFCTGAKVCIAELPDSGDGWREKQKAIRAFSRYSSRESLRSTLELLNRTNGVPFRETNTESGRKYYYLPEGSTFHLRDVEEAPEENARGEPVDSPSEDAGKTVQAGSAEALNTPNNGKHSGNIIISYQILPDGKVEYSIAGLGTFDLRQLLSPDIVERVLQQLTAAVEKN